MISNILIIDESEDDQRRYLHALRDFGCVLQMASTAEAAFARIADSRPDLILIDYNLPDTDGLSFMKRLAEYTADPIPIVMLTGEDNSEVAVEVMKHGADDYLVKDTEGRYLRLLQGVAMHVMAAHAQREQAQRLQKETETLLLRNQALMKNAMDGIHVMDMQGNIVEANDAFCHMLGYTREEMARLNVADWDAQWSAQELRERFKWLLGQNARFETVHRRKDGALLHVEITTSGMEIGGQHFLFAASRDITERKQAEAELRIASVAFESQESMMITDANTVILRVNQAFTDSTGYTAVEAVGQTPRLLKSGSHNADFYRAMWETIHRTGTWQGEILDRRKNGESYPAWLTISAVKGGDGAVTHYVWSHVDITERKRAENAKSAFMANMSHEIRTPLHGIIGLAHLLRRDPANPVQLQRLDQLCATSEHLLALVNDILDLSKIEADRLVIDDSAFRLGAVTDRVQEVIGRLASDKGLTLVIDIAPALRDATLRGDPPRLSQVLINLGGNAVKFSGQGVIRLGVDILEEDDASLRVRFSVQDNGIGIAPEDQARIFLPFEQLDESTTREYGGTGLGLTICQRLVSMMGGSIRVDSKPGLGSTFSFDLSLPRGVSAPKAPATMAAAPSLAGTRVLVAEDHPLGQEIILEMLEDLGCHADIATNGVEAVECARAYSYDLILMDMQMPKMDGLAATRAIRALPGRRDTPIIALTANAFTEDRQRCFDAGMNGYISKPATPASLVAAFSQWLPGVPVSGGEDPPHESELSIALMKIPGLDLGPVWRRSPQRLADYCVLLDSFMKMHGEDMARLGEYLAAGEHDAAHAVAHNLKGVAGLIGARQVESLATELVQGLRSGADQAVMLSLARACEAELMRLTEAVRTLPLLQAVSDAT